MLMCNGAAVLRPPLRPPWRPLIRHRAGGAPLGALGADQRYPGVAGRRHRLPVPHQRGPVRGLRAFFNLVDMKAIGRDNALRLVPRLKAA